MKNWLLGGLFLVMGVAYAVEPDAAAYLEAHPDALPRKVALKGRLSFSLMMDGKVIGSVTKNAETEVDVVRYTPPTLELTSGNGHAAVAPEQTDFWERVERSRLKAGEAVASSPTPSATMAPVQAAATPAVTPDAPPPETTANYQLSLPPRDNYRRADFALRVFGPRPVQGVLVLMYGSVDSPLWQSLARDLNLALLEAIYVREGDNALPPTTVPWYWAADGSGDALLNALKDLARKSHHPELATAPLLLWGHSAGGQFNYEFACWKPKRVIAFVVNKGRYYNATMDAQVRKVPALFIAGGEDLPERMQNITALYERGRNLGAPWALVCEPNATHEVGRSDQMTEAFFRAVIPLRLVNGKLADIDEERVGWKAAIEDHKIEPAATSKLTKFKSGWLPDEASAKVWLSVVSGT